jgi:hypothetical protein
MQSTVLFWTPHAREAVHVSKAMVKDTVQNQKRRFNTSDDETWHYRFVDLRDCWSSRTKRTTMTFSPPILEEITTQADSAQKLHSVNVRTNDHTYRSTTKTFLLVPGCG